MIHKFQSNGFNLVLDVNSGAVHIFDELTYKILDFWPNEQKIFENLKTFPQSEIQEGINEIKELQKNGLLFTEDFAPPDLKNYKPVIKAMCLHVAHACNLKCKYCFAQEGSYHGENSLMSFDVGKHAIDFLIKNSGNRKNLEIDFFGGEPLLNFDVVKKIVDYARSQEKIYDKNFRFTMTTNGILLDDEKIDYLNENMYNVVLSIDGRKSVNDNMRQKPDGSSSYDCIIPKFQKFAKLRGEKNYYVRGTFTHYNLDFVEDILHLNDLGFDQISVEPVVAAPSENYALQENDLPIIFDQYDRLTKIMLDGKRNFNFFHFMLDLDNGSCFAKRVVGCGAATEYLAVAPNGDLYPCHQFVGIKNFKMGNVADNELNQQIKNDFNSCNVYSKIKCNSCWAKFFCSGGCSANAFNFNKNIFEPYDYACELQKKRLECALVIKAVEKKIIF